MVIEEILVAILKDVGLPAFFIYAWYVERKSKTEFIRRYLDFLERQAARTERVTMRDKKPSQINEAINIPEM